MISQRINKDLYEKILKGALLVASLLFGGIPFTFLVIVTVPIIDLVFSLITQSPAGSGSVWGAFIFVTIVMFILMTLLLKRAEWKYRLTLAISTVAWLSIFIWAFCQIDGAFGSPTCKPKKSNPPRGINLPSPPINLINESTFPSNSIE
ncbi:MAG: hypothetical protein KC582_02900 [Candidatus Magasanikbacteria bacterium]|mgnify:CR=1 FL=1|nr:hypothetical protein [Candidatus Magasanikbacteria bacterium]MCA9391177.1 hypothetical protein [Candidatus Magasanikbacteria bacterium]HPF95509.1 hypothetical protein [bacterium]